MRFRLLVRTQQVPPVQTQGMAMSSGMTVCHGHWKPVGGVREAETHEEALHEQRPTKDGKWLVLCETDQTWRMFNVHVRKVLDLTAIDEAGDISTALVVS